jgi:hypothetical protein
MRALALLAALPACIDPTYGELPPLGGHSCDAQWEGRFVESAWDRGVDAHLQPTVSETGFQGPQTGVIADDLDGDGDIDLLFWDGQEVLHLYENDGGGDFTRRELPGAPDIGEHRLFRAVGAGDLDGDGLRDLVWTGDGATAVATNEGGLAFSSFDLVHFEEGDVVGGYASLAFGDIDGDGDLDVSLAGLDAVVPGERPSESPADWQPTGDLLLRNVDGQLDVDHELVCPDGPSLSLLQVFSDRDQDGDLDLFAWSDRSGIGDIPLGVVWRNDGGTRANVDLIDDAHEINAASPASAMGHASADLNGDLLPDYCVSDTQDYLTCLVSDGSGGYYEAGRALGLTAEMADHPLYPGPEESRYPSWVSWGVVMVDLDNDGQLDAAASGAPLPAMGSSESTPSPRFQPTWLWRGRDGGFVDALDGGLVSDRWAWGMVSADLDGDGAREIIKATAAGRPEIWDNPCTVGHWVEVALEGTARNVHGVGATILVTTGDQTRLMEVGSLTTGGQSPAALHFGLGNADRVDRIEVRWPGGDRTVVRDIAVDQHIVIAAE